MEYDIFETQEVSLLVPPTSYQGGKQRIAGQILDIISSSKETKFYDLCCGCGAISLELVNRGHNPKKITMVDKGPWGLFWKAVGSGQFDLNHFYNICSNVPSDVAKIQGFMESLSKQSSSIDTIYVFLLLQASSFGGKAIWIKDGCWKNFTCRSYWLPTATSKRRSPVNPMMPMVETLKDRVRNICDRMHGVDAFCDDIHKIEIDNGIAYIDPPYSGTTVYGYICDVMEFVRENGHISIYISEGVPLGSEVVKISSGRDKGGIYGGHRKKVNEEWLSIFIPGE